MSVFCLCSGLIAAPKLSLSGSSYQIGETVVVQFSGTPKNSRDWIGLFKKGRKLTRSQAEAWLYLDGTTVGYTGLSSGLLSFPEQGLSKKATASSLVTLWSKHKRLLSRERAKEISAKSISLDGNKLRYLQKVFGSAPREGRSLWISLHGGGSAPASVNDQQWRNQIELYQPAEGYYVAPRAPTDSWNMWFKPHITPLFDRLIENYVVKYRVNPDKVYVLGYSAGGDGVYQIGPRMADRWAAASMMAGHPNDAQPVNLRNIGFGLFMGANDSSYNRNGMAEKWKGLLSNLRKADPGGYQHRVRIYPGLGHWMNLRDAESIPWMAKFTRNPWPDRVVWRQDGVIQTRFYWLGVAKSDHVNGRRIEATVNGQTISLTAKNAKRVTVRLSDSLVNLDDELTVKLNGRVKFTGTVTRLKSELSRSLEERVDNTSAASAKITVGSDKQVWINGNKVDEVFLDAGEYRTVLFEDDSNRVLASTRFQVIPKRPKLTGVRNPDGSLTLTFEGSLEYGPTVAGPWQQLGWSSPRTVSITSKQRFFRSKN
ncbi:MAG: hypothetical protein QF600_02685 [Verrucomicrobiota bacterium]|nr:hypothetical protein [Verrucomicrobiota bacterium]